MFRTGGLYIVGAWVLLQVADLALETLGLASCCVNWPDIENKEVRMAELLDLDPDERIFDDHTLGGCDAEALGGDS